MDEKSRILRALKTKHYQTQNKGATKTRMDRKNLEGLPANSSLASL